MTQFCYSDHENFIKLPQLLHSFNHDSHSEQSQQAIKRFHAIRATLETGCDPNAPDSFDKMMLAWDTGASFGLTPFRRDFIDYVEVELPVKDVTKVNKVIGVGTAIFKFKNASGHDIFLPCIAYHLPTADIRLFSPQTYHQTHGGRSEIDADQVIMKLRQETIIIPIERGGCNLPIIYDAAVTEQKQRAIGIQYKTKLAMSGLREMDAMAGISTSKRSLYYGSVSDVEAEYRYYDWVCCQSIQSEKNANLSGPQKELLLWHWKLGCSMSRVQEMMRPRTIKDEHGRETTLPPVVKPAFASTPNCVRPKCLACELACAKRRNAGVSTQNQCKNRRTFSPGLL